MHLTGGPTRSYGRTSHALVGSAAAVVVVALSGCATDGSTEVEAVGPDAIAGAATEVTSGHMEMTSESDGIRTMTEGRFEGDDRSFSNTVEHADGATTGDAFIDGSESRTRTVDGMVYTDAASMRGLPATPETAGTNSGAEGSEPSWIRYPESDLGPSGDLNGYLEDPLKTMVGVLAGAVVEQPGETIEVDGMSGMRHEMALDGSEASQLLVDMGFSSGVDSLAELAEEHPDAKERFEALREYLDAHSEATVVVELADGQLRNMEMTAGVDLEEYPRCGLFGIDTSEVHLVLDQIDEPQNIVAPPADEVMTWEQFADRNGSSTNPSEGGDPPPDPAALDEAIEGGFPEPTEFPAITTTTMGGPDQGIGESGTDPGPDVTNSDDRTQEDPASEEMLAEMFAGCPGG